MRMPNTDGNWAVPVSLFHALGHHKALISIRSIHIAFFCKSHSSIWNPQLLNQPWVYAPCKFLQIGVWRKRLFWRTFGVREQSCSETLITPFVFLIIHLFSDENVSFIWISSRKSYSCARWPHYFYHRPNLAYIFKFLIFMFKFGLISIVLLFILLYLYATQMHNITQ